VSHVVESCPLAGLGDGLSRPRSADGGTVLWLTSCGWWRAYDKKNDRLTLDDWLGIPQKRTAIEVVCGWSFTTSQLPRATAAGLSDICLSAIFLSLTSSPEVTHVACPGI